MITVSPGPLVGLLTTNPSMIVTTSEKSRMNDITILPRNCDGSFLTCMSPFKILISVIT